MKFLLWGYLTELCLFMLTLVSGLESYDMRRCPVYQNIIYSSSCTSIIERQLFLVVLWLTPNSMVWYFIYTKSFPSKYLTPKIWIHLSTGLFSVQYNNRLNTGLVWYSNGRFVSGCQMVQIVLYSNGPTSHMTFPFEKWMPLLSGIQMNPVFKCSVFKWLLLKCWDHTKMSIFQIPFKYHT